MPRLPPAEEVVDAEFEEYDTPVERPAARPDVTQLRRDDAGQWYDPHLVPSTGGLEQYEARARALALFVKVPLLAYVALHKDMPVLVRLGAAAMAFLEASEIAKQSGVQVPTELPSWVPPEWVP